MYPFTSTLKQAQRGLSQPNDQPQYRQGWVSPGTYAVQQFLPHQEQGNVDYALIKGVSLPDTGTWIRTRSFSTQIAPVVSKKGYTAGVDHGDLFAMPETTLWEVLGYYSSFYYALEAPSYPFPLPSLTVPLKGRSTNAGAFLEGLLVKSFAQEKKLPQWGEDLHAQVTDTLASNDLFGIVNAFDAAGIATKLPNTYHRPGPWTLVQGWRTLDPKTDGHAFIILRHHAESDKVLTLEATSLPYLRGVGHRGIGKVDFRGGAFRFPYKWWEKESVPTWNQIKETFPHMEMAALHIVPQG